MKWLMLGVIAAALVAGGVVARATPPAGVAGGPVLARGTVAEPLVIGTPTTVTVTRKVRFRVSGKNVVRNVTLKVPSVRPLITCSAASPCDTAVQQVTLNPGGHTGWHTHPGPTWVAVSQGEGTLYHGAMPGCPGHKFGVNAGFFQPASDIHTLRNEGSAPHVVYAFYVLPQGTPNTAIRADQPQPANCPNIP